MIGDLLLVHVHDTQIPEFNQVAAAEGSGVASIDANLQPATRRIQLAVSQTRSKPIMRWVLNIYVPLYFEIRTIKHGVPSRLPNPRRDELQTIFQGLLDRIGKIFDGWTEIGRAVTTWRPIVWSGKENTQFRWIYQHMLIATPHDSWREWLQIAETECEESLLATVMHSIDFPSG